MNQQEVTTLMRTSHDEQEWNTNCDRVKAAYGGDYPNFWWSSIILSGLANEVFSTWECRGRGDGRCLGIRERR